MRRGAAMDAPRQLNLFEYARRAEAAPAKPAEAPLSVDRYRCMIHTTQVMQMNPKYNSREQGLLAKLERHLRRRVRTELGR